ncbi:Nn.00g009100.m01.CDS01 [Neocucurbitaria sp. VM-36]
MATYSAALMLGPGKGLEVSIVQADRLAPREFRTRNFAVALQPLDTKILIAGYGPGAQLRYPAVLGTSVAGIIEDLGEDVCELNVGDRVVFDTTAYIQIDSNRRMGTWQQLVVCDAKTVAKIGDVPFEQAVLVNFPLQAAVAALHVFLGMGKPGSSKGDGKFAKQVGYKVIVTASPRDFGRQKNLGAFEVVDYKASDVLEQLRALGPYEYLFTASGDPLSQQTLAKLLESNGGKFASVLPATMGLPENVEIVYSAFSQAAQKDEYGEWRDWWYQ